METKIEGRRQLLHASMVSFALLLRWLTREQALVMALLALIFNLLIIKRVGLHHFVFREKDHAQGYSWGILAYPTAVFLVILIFPLSIAAAAWALLALGDGASTYFGKRLGRKKLPWSPRKSYIGSLAFVLASFPASAFFLWWVGFPHPWQAIFLLALGGSLVAALVETIPWPLDDNLTVPLAGGGTMYLLSNIIPTIL